MVWVGATFKCAIQ